MHKNKTAQTACIHGETDKTSVSEDYRLASYNFDLPEELIAQYPSVERGGSRLYVLDRRNVDGVTKTVAGAEDAQCIAEGAAAFDQIAAFSELARFLPGKCLLVANNSRVVPARLQGLRHGGGKFELLLLTPLPLLEAEAAHNGAGAQGWNRAVTRGLLRPSKKFRLGERHDLHMRETGDADLRFTLLRKSEFGQCEAMLEWRGNLPEIICRCGRLPLPPYIRREADMTDQERYQTVFSNSAKSGSVAAPTAGLHFTEAMREKLLSAGHEWAELSLFVGYGTFSPVRTEDIRDHEMHPEYVEISAETVQKILQAKRDGRRVIAVGTTSTRVLEGLGEQQAAAASSALLRPYTGWLNCFIHPGKPVRVIDGLLTNFHLPESTLLMLVSTLCGRKRLLAAYARAVEAGMHFFSYGDAMLII